MHGVDFTVVEKTEVPTTIITTSGIPAGYTGGMTMANPLIASPIYNKDGDMSFKYNRIRALHLGWVETSAMNGHTSQNYHIIKLGELLFKPIPNILENFFYFCISFLYSP